MIKLFEMFSGYGGASFALKKEEYNVLKLIEKKEKRIG